MKPFYFKKAPETFYDYYSKNELPLRMFINEHAVFVHEEPSFSLNKKFVLHSAKTGKYC